MARAWSIMISQSLAFPAIPFGRNTLRRLSPVSRDAHGNTTVEGCSTAFRRSVWITGTGRVLPGSVPRRGFRSAT